MCLNPQALAKYAPTVTYRDLDNVMDGCYEWRYGIGSHLDPDARFELTRVVLDDVPAMGRPSVFLDDADRADYDWLCGAMKARQNVPPIALELVGGEYRAIDGHHRVALARELGITELPAYVHHR